MLRLPRFARARDPPRSPWKGDEDKGGVDLPRLGGGLSRSPAAGPRSPLSAATVETGSSSSFRSSATRRTYSPEQGDTVEEVDVLDGFDKLVVPDGAPADLICEECERRHVVLICEVCDEALCWSCADLLHLKGTNRRAHSHVRDGAIRHLQDGDVSSVSCAKTDEMNEQDDTDRFLDYCIPPLEAPKINILGIEAKRPPVAQKIAGGKGYRPGDFVIVAASAVDTLSHIPQGPEWKEPELYAKIISCPHARHGSEYEEFVRVEILGPASWDYSDPLFCMEVSSKDPSKPADRPPSHVQIQQSSGTAPLVKEKLDAMRRDRAVEKIRRGKTLPPIAAYEIGLGEGDQERLKGAIATVPLTEIFLPRERQLWVEEKKSRLLARVGSSLARCTTEAGLRDALTKWRRNVLMMRHCVRDGAALRLQARFRGWLARKRYQGKLQDQERALIEARRRIHKQFRYMTDTEREVEGGGFTTGKAFFRTKKELNKFEAIYSFYSSRAFQHLIRRANECTKSAFMHWVHFTRDAISRDIPPLAFDAMLDAEDEDKVDDIARIPYFAETIKLPPFKPAGSTCTGAAHNTWLHSLKGPTAFSSWIVPGLVLMGSYPDANRLAYPFNFKQEQHRDSASSLLKAGITTFIALCSEEECKKYEEGGGLPNCEKSFDARLKALTAEINATFRSASSIYDLCEQELRNVQMLQGVETFDQDKFHEILAKCVKSTAEARRAASRAENQQRILPKSTCFKFSPLDASDWNDLPACVHSLNALCEDLEERVSRGERVYLWTIGGHGWCGAVSAALLTRWYGCSVSDALERVQLVHDVREDLSRPGVESSTRERTSCPQTLLQRQAAALASVEFDAAYRDLRMVRARPTSKKASIEVKRCLRELGAPKYKPMSEIIYNEADLQEIIEQQARRRRAQATVTLQTDIKIVG